MSIDESQSDPPDGPLAGDPQPGEQQVVLTLPRRWWLTLIGATVLVITTAATAEWLFSSATDLLITILMAVFLAFAMLPAVDALSIRGWRRGPATGVVMLVGALVAVVFVAAILNVFVQQTITLVDRLPEYAETVEERLDELGIDLDTEEVDDGADSASTFLEDNFDEIVGGGFAVASSVFNLLFKLLTISLFLFYLLADAPRWRSALLSRMPAERQRDADQILNITIEKVGGYVYSRSVLAAASAVFHFAAFWLIGLPAPFALALWVGVVSQFIPTVGTYLAGALPVLLALVDDPPSAIIVLLAILVYQQIENYLLSPRITANTMDLHPAIGFGGAIFGASLLGGVGALLSLPVAATIKALIETYTESKGVVESERFESPEAYEARLAARRRAKSDKRQAKSETRRRLGRAARPAAADDEA